MKVSVDADLCQGHARCWDLCPEVFSLDDEGHAFVPAAEVPVELQLRVRKAADLCPECAIAVS